jgi:hypothetical protein
MEKSVIAIWKHALSRTHHLQGCHELHIIFGREWYQGPYSSTEGGVAKDLTTACYERNLG